MASLPPTSPTKKALRYFLEKKEEEFKLLNGRLALCIGKVRTLEGSNGKLTEEKKTLQELNTKLTTEIAITKRKAETEVANLRNFYESKLADVNWMLEESTREKTREQIENRKNSALVDEYKKK